MDREIFDAYVFGGQDYPPDQIEQAALAVRRQLGSTELRRVNDALLARLADAKESHGATPRRDLLDEPAIQSLVNTIIVVNQAWIASVISKSIRHHPHLRNATVKELFSTAVTGEGAVGGVMNAILAYDYRRDGVGAFGTYLGRAITNALALTFRQKRVFRRVEARMRSLSDYQEDRQDTGWVDRTAPRPEAVAINRELIEVVQSVIPDLPTKQQRDTAAWMIDRILTTGELPMAREAAQIQKPRVSRERGRQIMEATVESIRKQIESDYPQLAAQGINGWEQFKGAFARISQLS